MEEDLAELDLTESTGTRNHDSFRRLGVWAGSLCAGAWGLFAVYVFFKEKVTLNNIGFFLFLFVGCLPAYFLPYGLLRLIGRIVNGAPNAEEEY